MTHRAIGDLVIQNAGPPERWLKSLLTFYDLRQALVKPEKNASTPAIWVTAWRRRSGWQRRFRGSRGATNG